tara:strand:+ start:278 stop:553 length:276 start_codon:yes stop_codon:yes gene_type:complete
MATPIWGKPKRKKGMDLFWGLPDGPKSKYPYNEEYDPTGYEAEEISPPGRKGYYPTGFRKYVEKQQKEGGERIDKLKKKLGTYTESPYIED